MLLALAGAALLVGAFIIFNTFSITVAQRTREFALLRALGATRRQIVAAVAGEALVLGVDRLGARAARRARVRASASARCSTPPASASRAPGWSSRRARSRSSLGVGVGVTLLAALAPALRATRVSPVAGARRHRRSPRAAPGALAPWIAAIVSVGGLALLLSGLFGDGPATARMASMAGGAVLVFVGIALTARHIVRPVAALVGWPLERAFHTPGPARARERDAQPGPHRDDRRRR